MHDQSMPLVNYRLEVVAGLKLPPVAHASRLRIGGVQRLLVLLLQFGKDTADLRLQLLLVLQLIAHLYQRGPLLFALIGYVALLQNRLNPLLNLLYRLLATIGGPGVLHRGICSYLRAIDKQRIAFDQTQLQTYLCTLSED